MIDIRIICMRKKFKKVCIVAVAAVLAASSAFFAGCDYKFTPLDGEVTGEVSSQGGFVVEKGDWVYFINGVETHTSDNTYGTPVKGALMRIKTADIKAGSNTAETVVPSLMVAADYSSGLFIYGDRIYYATPNTVGNTQGEIDNTVLSFRSAKLDGSEVKEHFRVSDNATVYRFVEVDGVVYIVYVEDSMISSYNTATDTNTALVKSVGAYVLNSADKSDPYIYYTMSVTDHADTDAPYAYTTYNQLYRVRADVTEAPYTYTWDQEYLDDHDGEAPYYNLGTLVLDGIGLNNVVTQFSHDVTTEPENRLSYGYTYTLQAYTNGGIYFTRSSRPTAGSSAAVSGGELYYLSADKIGAAGWNSVAGNSVYTTANAAGALEVVAGAADTANASSAAIFYIDEDAASNVKHHYLYVSGSEIYRTDVINDGNGTKARIGEGGLTALRIASDASDATLVSLDSVSDATYSYVYYTKTDGDGLSVERAVYNGDAEDYRTLSVAGGDNAPYQPVQVLDVQHVSSWYNYEVVDGIVFYADAKTYGENTYNYVWAVDLTNADGTAMNNKQITAVNEKYESIVGEDDGYLAKLSEEGNGKLSGMIEYYFYTGERSAIDENIAESVENGKSETYLYSETEKEAFDAFLKGEGDAAQFKDDNGTLYTQRSYFTVRLGAMSDTDTDSLHDYWRSVLQRYTVEDQSDALPTWAWVLIGIGCGVVVAGAAVTAALLVRKRRKGVTTVRKERMEVDTTDDRDVDVYAVNDAENTASADGAESGAEALAGDRQAEAQSVDPISEGSSSAAAEPVDSAGGAENADGDATENN